MPSRGLVWPPFLYTFLSICQLGTGRGEKPDLFMSMGMGDPVEAPKRRGGVGGGAFSKIRNCFEVHRGRKRCAKDQIVCAEYNSVCCGCDADV